MRTHNPLQEPAPWKQSPAARFAFLIRRDGTPAVATGDYNVRVTQRPIAEVLRRFDAVTHILRMDYEITQISKDGYIYLTLSPRQEGPSATP